MLTTTLLSYVNVCGKPSKRLKCSPCQRMRDRSGTMIQKLMPFHWNQLTWSSLKLMPTGKRKVKGEWEEEPYEVEYQVAEDIPSYHVKNQQTGHS